MCVILTLAQHQTLFYVSLTNTSGYADIFIRLLKNEIICVLYLFYVS